MELIELFNASLPSTDINGISFVLCCIANVSFRRIGATKVSRDSNVFQLTEVAPYLMTYYYY